MPANQTINLLGTEDLQHTPWGRLISWATTYGRYTMITTEIVVLLAFISRFSLDRKLTDLKEEISQKQSIIEANLSFESSFRSLQDRMRTIKSLTASQSIPRDIIEELQQMLPPDVYFQSLTLGGGNLTIKTTAATTSGFSQFLANVSQSVRLQNIEISGIKKNPLTGIEFQLTATMAKSGTKK
ncbi:PilN domain-containing protein [Candidatus Gottesmanbacteria bacterium]|nr:PilN domain-containing protein [Candidatus Gottesmanbacteria bacterium]